MTAENIVSRIPVAFEEALHSGDLLFFPSTVQTNEESGIKFEIRLCSALQKKPPLPPHLDLPPAELVLNKPPDPLSPPYNSKLFVGEVKDHEGGSDYVVLLNKYCVVSQHFLLVTKEYQSQSSPLMPPDLVQTYMLLAAARKAGKRYIAFYNCGDNSGASQPHKHIQFIPIEDENAPPVEHLAQSVRLETPDKPFSLTSLPYANHVFRFPPYSLVSRSQIELMLSQAFLFLLDLVISTVRHDPDYPPGRPSYNVFITLEHMHLIPRRHEAYTLGKTGEKLSVNTLGFAGMLLVKSEKEMEAVKDEGVLNILRGVGLRSVHDLQVAGTSLEAMDTNGGSN